MLGISYLTARKYAGLFNYPFRHANCQIDWDTVDWTLRDRDIAEQVGVSRERVRQIRKKLNKPESPDKWESSIRIKLKKFILENRDTLIGLPLREVIRRSELKATPYIAGEIMKELEIPVRQPGCPSSYPWETMNWDLPNSDIAKAWGITNVQGIANKRFALKKGSSKWDPRCGTDLNSEDRFEALQHEIIKATSYFQDQGRPDKILSIPRIAGMMNRTEFQEFCA
jgi:hypothetical protein